MNLPEITLPTGLEPAVSETKTVESVHNKQLQVIPWMHMILRPTTMQMVRRRTTPAPAAINSKTILKPGEQMML